MEQHPVEQKKKEYKFRYLTNVLLHRKHEENINWFLAISIGIVILSLFIMGILGENISGMVAYHKKQLKLAHATLHTTILNTLDNGLQLQQVFNENNELSEEKINNLLNGLMAGIEPSVIVKGMDNVIIYDGEKKKLYMSSGMDIDTINQILKGITAGTDNIVINEKQYKIYTAGIYHVVVLNESQKLVNITNTIKSLVVTTSYKTAIYLDGSLFASNFDVAGITFDNYGSINEAIQSVIDNKLHVFYGTTSDGEREVIFITRITSDGHDMAAVTVIPASDYRMSSVMSAFALTQLLLLILMLIITFYGYNHMYEMAFDYEKELYDCGCIDAEEEEADIQDDDMVETIDNENVKKEIVGKDDELLDEEDIETEPMEEIEEHIEEMSVKEIEEEDIGDTEDTGETEWTKDTEETEKTEETEGTEERKEIPYKKTKIVSKKEKLRKKGRRK